MSNNLLMNIENLNESRSSVMKIKTYQDYEKRQQQNYIMIGNKHKIQEWIFKKMKKAIVKNIAKVLQCKKKDINYWITVEYDKPKHKNVWYGHMDILDFFRKAQRDFPGGCWMALMATAKKNIPAENEDQHKGQFWIADARSEGSTDVGGLVMYLWEHALDVDTMTDKDKKLPWGPNGDYYGKIN